MISKTATYLKDKHFGKCWMQTYLICHQKLLDLLSSEEKHFYLANL